MAETSPTQPSFSRGRRWSIGFNVVLATVAAFVCLLAVNYVSGQFFSKRFYLSARAATELSPRTENLLRSLTNHVNITLYYEDKDSIYEDIVALLDEYRARNRGHISIMNVDPVRDAAAGELIKAKYGLIGPKAKNLIIFDCSTNGFSISAPPGRFKIIPGDMLAQYTIEQMPSEDAQKPEFRKKPLSFNGELLFTSTLLQIINPLPLKAYFLQGNGEPAIDDGETERGFKKFADILRQNYIEVLPLYPSTNPIPLDCNLLIAAGARNHLPEPELAQINQYLAQGGRLFAAFDNVFYRDRDTGLEQVLAKWGVNVSSAFVMDVNHSLNPTHTDMAVENFADHPAVNRLAGTQLYMVRPRMISKTNLPAEMLDPPKVTEIVFTSPEALLTDNSLPAPRTLPLMVAVEKGAVKGVTTERGTTRMIVAGDSLFLSNKAIQNNVDFANFAINWLLDRTILLQGIGPRPVVEYQMLMTRQQRTQLAWIFLGAIPGGVLAFGGLVWLRRRK